MHYNFFIMLYHTWYLDRGYRERDVTDVNVRLFYANLLI